MNGMEWILNTFAIIIRQSVYLNENEKTTKKRHEEHDDNDEN